MRRTVICAAVLAAALLSLPAAALAADQTIFVGTTRTVCSPAGCSPTTSADVTVNPGDTVSWNWKAGTQDDHHILSDSQALDTEHWDFGVVAQGLSGVRGTHTFTRSGSFRFHCALHPSLMFGVVTVTGLPNVQLDQPTPTPAGDVFAGATVSFNATGSDTDGTIDSVDWDFGDGTPHETTAPGSATITAATTHAYAQPGTFTAKVTVTDDRGNTNVATRTVTVFTRDPTASFTASPATVAKGGSITFNAAASSDRDGVITKYEWDLDGNGTFETDTGTTKTATATYPNAGTFTVGLRVTDNDVPARTAVATTSVVITNPPPPPPPPPAGGGGSTTGGSTTGGTAPKTTTPSTTTTAPTAVAAVRPVPIAAPAPVASAAPLTASAPTGQKLRRQKGVRVTASCGAACKLVATGAVKVKGKRLRLARATATLSSAGTTTLALKIDKRDLKALRRAKGKAQATITLSATTGGRTIVQKVAVSLIS